MVTFGGDSIRPITSPPTAEGVGVGDGVGDGVEPGVGISAGGGGGGGMPSNGFCDEPASEAPGPSMHLATATTWELISAGRYLAFWKLRTHKLARVFTVPGEISPRPFSDRTRYHPAISGA